MHGGVVDRIRPCGTLSIAGPCGPSFDQARIFNHNGK